MQYSVLNTSSTCGLDSSAISDPTSVTAHQGPTLVHFSAQRKRFLWYWGCI